MGDRLGTQGAVGILHFTFCPFISSKNSFGFITQSHIYFWTHIFLCFSCAVHWKLLISAVNIVVIINGLAPLLWKSIQSNFYLLLSHIRHCLFFPACCCADALWLYLNFLHSNAALLTCAHLPWRNLRHRYKCVTLGAWCAVRHQVVTIGSAQISLFLECQSWGYLPLCKSTHIFASFSKASGHVISENEQESKFCLCFWRKELSFVHFQCKDLPWHSL